MSYRIIISHHQAEHLSKFPIDLPTAVVFDAYEDVDAYTCHDLGFQPVIVPQAGNRGFNRNKGLEYLMNGALIAQEDVIEFFDGDRYPVYYNPCAVQRLMDRHALDGMLFMCQADTRDNLDVPSSGALLVDTGALCNPFYSCGFAMRFNAIEKVLKFNKGCFFESSFDQWGCEDQYMGLVCAHLNLRIGITKEYLLNGSVGGNCDDHPEYRDSLQQYVNLIRARNLEIRNQMRYAEYLK